MSDGWDAQGIARLAPASLFDLTGRVAVVTGAAGGIGRWLAAGLGSAGAAVMLTDNDATALDGVATLLTEAGVTCDTLVADLGDPDAPRAIIEAACRFGQARLDVLVNCAAINRRMPLLEVDPATYDDLMNIDLRAPFFLAQAAADRMSTQGSGVIVNVSSINAAVGLQGVGVYGPAKAAISQLTKVMAVEWAHRGIRANALAPGFVRTPLTAALWEDEVRGDWIVRRTPAGRPAEPYELVGACLLLASDAGSFLNGETLYVDGGFLAGSRWAWD